MTLEIDFDRARFNMVEQQIRTWDVLDHRVLDVLHTLPREAFVGPEHQGMAYADVELPIGFDQRMFKPVIEGRILQAIKLQGAEDILEIGTGSGFFTACLAKLGGVVHSIEIQAELAAQAQNRLAQHAPHKTTVEVVDVLAPDFRPLRQFDVIVVGAAFTNLPDWKSWLKPGGRLFAVRGHSPVMEAVLLHADGHTESLFETDLPYLIGAAPVKKFVL
jgi:protein-L-isoaspartate(D-aspartate) O-methyltransferase